MDDLVPRTMPSKSMEDVPVINSRGEKLGKVTELLIDLDNGRVAYAQLSMGGFLGIGDKIHVVPWEVLKFDPDQESFLLDIPREKLETAPGIQEFDPANTEPPQRGNQIYHYYGINPYWHQPQ